LFAGVVVPIATYSTTDPAPPSSESCGTGYDTSHSPFSSCGGKCTQSALIRASDAAFLRLKVDGTVRNLYQYTGLNSPSLAKEGNLVDVLTFYLSEDGQEEEYPYPERATLASNTRLAQVLDSGVVYVCDFVPDYIEFDMYQLPKEETYASRLQSAIWAKVGEHYGVDIRVKWVYSSPKEGSSKHFDNTLRGRNDGGCDVDSAPASMGGYFENFPRTTGPLGQFVASLPLQAAAFSVVVADGSSYQSFDDILLDVPRLTVCFANRNDGVTETYFRNAATLTKAYFMVVETCEQMVRNDRSGKTIFFSEFESTADTEKKEGLRTLFAGVVVPIATYSTTDPAPPSSESCGTGYDASHYNNRPSSNTK
jgi:hypothetical protein